MASNEAEIWYVTSGGAVEATLRVSKYLEVIEVMTSNHATSPSIIYTRGRGVMLSLVSLVRFGCFSTFFASTEPQEFNSDIDLHNGTRQCALGPILRPEIITLVFVVQSLSVLPFFTSTEPQESNFYIDSRNGTRQYALKPILIHEILTLLSVV